MTYPSILTAWDGAPESASAFDLAIDLAERWSAHLDVACLGVDRTATGFYAADMARLPNAALMQSAAEEAEALASEARSRLSDAEISYTVRTAALRLGEMPAAVARAAWFQDLIVLPDPFGRVDEELAEATLDAALFNAPAPTIVSPDCGRCEVGSVVLLAWNGSMEAARALRAALPILKTAKLVEAVTIQPPGRVENGTDPAFALGAMLSRHKANAEIAVVPQTEDTIADTLKQRAKEIGADLIVMGAYGHSRFRERMLGGATRDMLKTADRPILFAR